MMENGGIHLSRFLNCQLPHPFSVYVCFPFSFFKSIWKATQKPGLLALENKCIKEKEARQQQLIKKPLSVDFEPVPVDFIALAALFSPFLPYLFSPFFSLFFLPVSTLSHSNMISVWFINHCSRPFATYDYLPRAIHVDLNYRQVAYSKETYPGINCCTYFLSAPFFQSNVVCTHHSAK